MFYETEYSSPSPIFLGGGVKIIEQNWNSDLQREMVCGEASFVLLYPDVNKRL